MPSVPTMCKVETVTVILIQVAGEIKYIEMPDMQKAGPTVNYCKM